MITTTLMDIREHGPCADGWQKLLKHLGKTQADGEPLPLLTVLESNGLDDTLWCLRALGAEHHGWIRHYAVDCAEQVRHLMTDERSLEALRVARLYADGKARDSELDAAADAADAAAAAADAHAAAAAYAADAAYAAARAWQSDRLREYLVKGGRP